MVLAAAFLLVLYVVGFLLAGITNSPSGATSLFSIGANVAWIPIQGEIAASGGSGSVSDTITVDALERASKDPSIDAIFLDIDSPGGSVVASKQIVAKIRQIDKPVVSWIGELGASGAYYIAASSDYVIADGDSITGSIGVISVLPNFVGLMEKLGITMENVKTGELKDVGSPYNTFTEEERTIFQGLVDEAFVSFVQDLREFRGDRLDETKFDEILDGRIVSGRQALEIGLIDQVGTREEALLKISELAGFEGRPALTSFIEKEFSLSDLFFSSGVQFGKGFVSSISSNASESAGLEAK
jgi:protease-4